MATAPALHSVTTARHVLRALIDSRTMHVVDEMSYLGNCLSETFQRRNELLILCLSLEFSVGWFGEISR